MKRRVLSIALCIAAGSLVVTRPALANIADPSPRSSSSLYVTGSPHQGFC
jgi:predicted secreted protein